MDPLAEATRSAVAPSAAPPNAVPPRSAIAPMSFAQQRLWLLDRLVPGTPAYNVRTVLNLQGPLDVSALRASLNDIVRRHEVLRTTFALVDEQPVQVIAESLHVTLPLIDLTELPDAERTRRLDDIVSEEVGRPFDLHAGPLLRATLVRTAAQEHLLIIVMHHIVTDAASGAILRRELAAGYGAFGAPAAPGLADLPVQYADFAAWQREWLTAGALEPDLDYWKRRLADAPTRTDLPSRGVADARRGFHAAAVSLELPAALCEDLRRFGAAQNATLFMTLLALFGAVLYRYTGQSDLVVGTPISERSRPELEGLIGLLINTLPLRIDVRGSRSVRETLDDTCSSVLEAFAHRDVPFERIVEAAQPERRAHATPLLNVMFALHRKDEERLAFGAVAVRAVGVQTLTTNFDLTLNVVEADGALRCTFVYDTAVLDDGLAAQMLRHFERLVRDAVARPELAISALAMLDDAERQRALVGWNQTSVDFPADRTLVDLFEAQVARRPDAVAVAAGAQHVSFAELDRRAERIAAGLPQAGVNSVVAVACERSIELVAAVLGALKAGYAYLPMAPNEPTERIAYMLADAHVGSVMTHRRFAGRFERFAIDVHEVDDDAVRDNDDASAPNPHREGRSMRAAQSSECPAYVMYTSGSTGKPKGVVVPHRAIARLVCNADYVQIQPTDVVAQVSSFAFDAVTFELWGALLNGARLEIIPRDVTLSPPDFAQALHDRRISVMLLTTALFKQMSRERPASFNELRCLLTGGEALDAASVNAVLNAGGPHRLLHAYGPTEATTIACSYEIPGVQDGIVPIGRPISNTQAYALDDDVQLVPVGVRGQLYLGGPGLALGYLGDPDLTVRRFIADPFSAGHGARLYGTGDTVRYRPDGNLEFLGRRDGQVKVRGFRVETAEVEAALRRHPAVRDAYVVARGDDAGDKRLLAYVVAAAAACPDGAGWRRYLAEVLPQYMLPASVIPLDALPLTPNGKVDSAQLPDPKPAVAPAGVTLLGNPLHYQLVALWEKHLGVAPIGIHDSFFDLGGHSLLAARLIADIESTLGRRLPLATLFDDPTIFHMADVLVRDVAVAASPIVALQPEGSRPPFFFLHGDITGGGYYAREFGRHLGPEQPLYVIAPHGVDGRPLPCSIEAMAVEYVAAIRAVRPTGPYVLGGHCSGGFVAFEIARQLVAGGDVVDNVILIGASGRNGRLAAFADRIETAAKMLGFSAGVRVTIRQQIGRCAWLMRRLRRRSRLGLAALFGRVTEELRARAQTDVPADLFGAWSAMAATYIPAAYEGRISVLAPGADGPSRRQSLAGWRAVSPRVMEYPIAGTHLTSITHHIRETARRVSECLDSPSEAVPEPVAHLRRNSKS